MTFELPLSAAGVQAKLLVRKVGDAWEFVRHYSVSENGLPTRRHEHLGEMNPLPQPGWVKEKLEELVANELNLGTLKRV
ncbi:hypothetical protein ACFSC4_00005 [Deinococcus malanensis]|uniref:hypothetical protein n=1 Tax=Deinococcus malanensis TaxID=1706855 RepID=UPI00363E48EE